MVKRRVRDSVDTDNDDEEKSFEYSVPLFTPVVPPQVISISHEALLKWRDQRREYEAKLIARCRASGEDYDTVT
ncbi:hypothetical protein P3T76_011592 [Phytophthora citrophthora]|uniref:Uncharacterized protein n=1 Tax=Phytophthora citrophthora TaxID=4793 RepID=A0AAD9LFN2_9STRA|nr:hypothetical protein P3T76_011592 [Phytophthora citrophthora]